MIKEISMQIRVAGTGRPDPEFGSWDPVTLSGTWARKDNNFNHYAANRTNHSAEQTAEERMAGYARVMQSILDGDQQTEEFAGLVPNEAQPF